MLLQPSGLDMLMTLDSLDTRKINLPLNLDRTKRFLFLMFSSNANQTTLFPLALVFTLNGILSHLRSTKLTSPTHSKQNCYSVA